VVLRPKVEERPACLDRESDLPPLHSRRAWPMPHDCRQRCTSMGKTRRHAGRAAARKSDLPAALRSGYCNRNTRRPCLARQRGRVSDDCPVRQCDEAPGPSSESLLPSTRRRSALQLGGRRRKLREHQPAEQLPLKGSVFGKTRATPPGTAFRASCCT
jgi:hypothetical protein